MNRRSFFQRLAAGIAGALATAQLDPEKLLWVPGQKSIFDLGATPKLLEPELASSAFRITMPDGTTWSFDGFVRSLAPEFPVDGLITTSLSIQPSGPITMEEAPRKIPLTGVPPAYATELQVLGVDSVQVHDIAMPRIEQRMSLTDHSGDSDSYVLGLKRMGPIEMTIGGSFEPETLRALLEHTPGKPLRRG